MSDSTFVTANNPLLATDVYKLGHQRQYIPGCNKVYSYLQARSAKTFPEVVFFGLQYYLKQYLRRPITREMCEEFLRVHAAIIGPPPQDVRDRILSLQKLGYWPLKIRAVPEGVTVPVQNVLMTIENTHPDFYWCVGYVESLLLKVWYSSTVATCSRRYRNLVDKMFAETCPGQSFLKPFMVHDFGYRGDTSEESAAISGAAHLLSFTGSDTIPALPFAERWYGGGVQMASVPASEHSVMCSFGQEDELAAFRHMLKTYPDGIVSIVSDTYDVYRVLTEFAKALKPEILARNGKVVFRPDSGDPEKIICGDSEAAIDSPAYWGAIRLLDREFGSTVNGSGYRELNPKVGLIYGDGMYFERYERTLNRLKELGYASCNLVIGVGGILRSHTRDTLGFAVKASHVEVHGIGRDIEKCPVTDTKKKSHKGMLQLDMTRDGQFVTRSGCTTKESGEGLLEDVFIDGQLVRDDKFTSLQDRARTADWLKAYKESRRMRCEIVYA